MTPDELLRLYPRETLRWLRRRLGLSQLALAPHLGVNPKTLANWEARRHGISDAQRARLATLLAPHLARSAYHSSSIGAPSRAARSSMPRG